MKMQNITIHDEMTLPQLIASLPDSCQAKTEAIAQLDAVNEITTGAIDQVINSDLGKYELAFTRAKQYFVDDDLNTLDGEECRTRLQLIKVAFERTVNANVQDS